MTHHTLSGHSTTEPFLLSPPKETIFPNILEISRIGILEIVLGQVRQAIVPCYGDYAPCKMYMKTATNIEL